MKTKIITTVLVMALAAALIAGATSAWFTDQTELPGEVEFQAGTLSIDVDGGEFSQEMDPRIYENTNPGDCATISWIIQNTGTKRAEIRVKIDGEWDFEPDIDPNLTDYDGRAAFFAPKGEDWVMYEDDEGMWLYYVNEPLLGTYDTKGEVGESVELKLVVGFDGPNMDNQYKGQKFKISGEVQAVQTTNGAPEAVWGVDLAAIKDGTAENIYVEEYFTEGERGYDMPCWSGGGGGDQDEDKYEVIAHIEGIGEVNNTGDYNEGDDVTLVAVPGEGQKFIGWEIEKGLGDGEYVIDGATLSFTMPGNDVEVTAVFQAKEITLEDFELSWENSEVQDKNNKRVLLKTKIVNAMGSDGNPFNGKVSVTIWHDDHPDYPYTTNVQITNGESGTISTGNHFINAADPSVYRSKIRVQIGEMIRSPQRPR